MSSYKACDFEYTRKHAPFNYKRVPSHLSWRCGEGFGLLFKQNFKELVFMHAPGVIMYVVVKETFLLNFLLQFFHIKTYTRSTGAVFALLPGQEHVPYMAIQTFNIRKWFTGTAWPKTNRIFQFFFPPPPPSFRFSNLWKRNRKSFRLFFRQRHSFSSCTPLISSPFYEEPLAQWIVVWLFREVLL